MKKKHIISLLLVIALAVSLIGCGKEGTPIGESAETDWPTKNITLVVPYAAGGSSDMSARPLSDKLQSILGKPVVVKNTAGAGGTIGAAEVLRTKPDGYNILNASIGPLTIAPYSSDINYTYEDFRAVAQITDIPLSLAVHKNSPFQTLEDFVQYAKDNPGDLQVGNVGAGNVQHVAMAYFESEAGIKITHVPYEGANPAVAALLGEHVDAIMTGTTEQMPHYNDGTFRVLAMTGEEKIDDFPDVNTFKEEGYPNIVFGIWYGIVAPKDTPDEVVQILDDAVKEALEDETVISSMEKLNLIISYNNHENFAKRIARDAEINQSILGDLGLIFKR